MCKNLCLSYTIVWPLLEYPACIYMGSSSGISDLCDEENTKTSCNVGPFWLKCLQ